MSTNNNTNLLVILPNLQMLFHSKKPCTLVGQSGTIVKEVTRSGTDIHLKDIQAQDELLVKGTIVIAILSYSLHTYTYS